MKRLLFITLGLVFSASMAFGLDIKKEGLGAAADLASGKSAKDIAEDKKKEAKDAAQKEINSKKAEAINKADEKTGGAASLVGGMMKK